MSEPNTVDVGCRIPNGVRLSVTKWIDDPQDKGKKIAREADMIELAGAGGHVGQAGLHHDIAYTAVDADLFQAWLDSHKDVESDLLTSGAVFKKGDGGDAEKEAQERYDLAKREREDREKLEEEHAERRAARPERGDFNAAEQEHHDREFPDAGRVRPDAAGNRPHATETHPLNPEHAPQTTSIDTKPRFDPETGKPIEPAKV